MSLQSILHPNPYTLYCNNLVSNNDISSSNLFLSSGYVTNTTGKIYTEIGASNPVLIPVTSILGGIYVYAGSSASDVIANLPSAADIMLEYPELRLGDSFSFLFVYSDVSAADSLTLQPGAGGQLSPAYPNNLPPGQDVVNAFTLWGGGSFANLTTVSNVYINKFSLRPLIVMTNVSSGTAAYTVYI